jgi:tetratricopeptide (TPR) repeat protein
MRSKLLPLVKLLYKPFEAIAELRANAPFLAGVLLAVVSTFFYYGLLSRWLYSFLYSLLNNSRRGRSPSLFIYFFSLVTESAVPVIFLAVIFIPACLFAANLFERRASFSRLFSQEYAPLATCIFYAWATAHLLMMIPAAIFMQMEPLSMRLALRFAPLPFFIFSLVLALRVVLRLSYARVFGVLATATLSLILLPLVPRLIVWLTSPFLLILVFFVLRNFFNEMISSQKARESFQQNLRAATLNPADASAHYNLGLIHQQRGEYEKAKAAFQRAIEIDVDEIDAHYQLGRIALEEQLLADAIQHFDEVVSRDEQHSQYEVWREIGHAYLQANQLEDARFALETFLAKRPFDAEALYHYGLTLHKLGQSEKASMQMRAVIEAVNSSPSYKQRSERRWLKEAEGFLRQT